MGKSSKSGQFNSTKVWSWITSWFPFISTGILLGRFGNMKLVYMLHCAQSSPSELSVPWSFQTLPGSWMYLKSYPRIVGIFLYSLGMTWDTFMPLALMTNITLKGQALTWCLLSLHWKQFLDGSLNTCNHDSSNLMLQLSHVWLQLYVILLPWILNT